MKPASEHSEDGVTARLFDLTVAGEGVPGVVWTPERAEGPRPLVLIGHGGSQHKGAPAVVGTAKRYAKALGYAVAAIDAPGHGARASADEARFAEKMREQIAQAGGMTGDALGVMVQRAARAVPEWKAALDAIQSLDFVGAGGPVGYLGMSMGAIVGIQFVAHEPRINAAVFGLTGVREEGHALSHAARRITVPIEFAMQWDDEFVSREAAIALFGAFGSSEKTLHANKGGHLAVPVFERSSWERFFVRHLGDVSASR
jgi:dienelactone hydrolase